MKEVQFENPNKMLMESGHKTFDAQSNLIGKGNVFSNTQKSLYIRPFNGISEQKGQLQGFDLKNWSGLPDRVINLIKEHAVDESVILYKFHHYNRNKEQIVHGYILTKSNYELISYLVTGPTYKSWNVIEECLEYVAIQEIKAVA